MNKTRLILGALVALAAASCTMEESFQDEQLKEQELTITATREGDETLTRTYRDDTDGSIWWVPGDAISLFYGSGTNGGSKFTSVNTTDTTKVTNFTGVITAITGGGEIAVDQTYFWGLYPYQEDASCDGTSVTMTLPKEQTAVPGTFATNTFPSIGRSQGLIMGFYNICSGMKFSVTKEGIKKVTLKSRNGELITGKAKISFDNGVPAAEIIDGSDEVVLEAPAGEYFEVGKFYFIVMFPTTFTNGFNLTFETFTEEATVEKTGKLTARRSNFGKIVNVDANASYTKKNGNILIEDTVFKTYLVENFDSNGDSEISYEEAESIIEINLSPTNEYNLQSLRGIEYMSNLEVINCEGNWYDSDGNNIAPGSAYYSLQPEFYQSDGGYHGPIGTLRYLDVSNNRKLWSLNVPNNGSIGKIIKKLNLSQNRSLNYLHIQATSLEYPDISGLSELRYIDFGYLHGTFNNDFSQFHQLIHLWLEYPDSEEMARANHVDVSGCPLLEELCVSNYAKSLSDLSLNPKLKHLHWTFCPDVGPIDLSRLPDLEVLGVVGCRLSSLDVTNNANLKILYADDNNLTGVNLSNNPLLEELNISWNSISELNLSNNNKLRVLNCIENQISSISLPNSLEYINCWNNPFGALDVSGLKGLISLCCANTGLTELDVTHNEKLVFLAFNDNQIGSIDLSHNPLLEEIACWNAGLTSLDLSHNPALTWVRCWGNQIITLDVSHNLLLGTRVCTNPEENGLWCIQDYNPNTGCNYLTTLYISENQMIPFITENRRNDHIPPETQIMVAPENGGGEGTGEDDWGDGN